MNGNKYLLDTNIALYLLGGDKQLAQLLAGADVYISIVTGIELLAYPGITPDEISGIDKFLQAVTIVPLRSDIKTATVDIRKSTRLKLPDSVIAATTRTLGIPLIISDNGFKRVDGIVLLDY